jgi:KDO2-lipid IV(A) lauroyltransferase
MSLKQFIKHVRHRAEYTVVRLAIAVLQALPPVRCEQFAAAMAVVCHRWLGLRHKVIAENLATAFPTASDAQRQRLTRDTWRHLFLMLAEIAHAPRKLHRVNWREWIDAPHDKPTLEILMQGRPIVLMSGHHGNFELGGFIIGLFGFPTHTVARTLDNPLLDRFVNDFRSRTGQHMLPKTGSRDAVEKLLAGGGTLALLGDQAAGDRACWVNFFGRPASTHKAVALFSLSYNAPMLVTATRRVGGMLRYEVSIVGQIDPAADDFKLQTIPEVTEWYTQQLETMICRAPEQYWWVHRRWKGTPPASVVRRLSTAA